MKDFLAGISPSSDGDLLHLSEGTTDFIGISYLDLLVDDEEEKENGR